jgi:hypothetical protein
VAGALKRALDLALYLLQTCVPCGTRLTKVSVIISSFRSIRFE